MKNKLLKHIIPLNLQLFAEDGGGEAEGLDVGGEGENEGEDGDDNEQPSFDDFLTDKKNQAEFDRRVNKAIQKAVTKAEAKWKAEHDDNLSEAEKLAKMSKEEKARYLFDKEKREFEDERNKFAKEKLEVEVTKQLQEEGIPTAFAKLLVNLGEAESISETIKEIKKEWDEKINEAVKAKARQSTPRDGGNIGGGARRESLREIASKARII